MKRTSNEGICDLLFSDVFAQDWRERLEKDQLDVALDRPSGRDDGKANDQDNGNER
jgi:hypothetical protein